MGNVSEEQWSRDCRACDHSRMSRRLCNFQTRRCIKFSIRDIVTVMLIAERVDGERRCSRRHLMDDSRLSTIRRLCTLTSSIHRTIC
jgi:hypothetical protein